MAWREGRIVATSLAVRADLDARHPWASSFPVDTARVASDVGLGRDAVDRALRRLVRSGVLIRADEHEHYHLDREVFTPAGATADLHWRSILDRLAGQPAHQLIVRVLADLLVSPYGEWQVLPRQDLTDATAYERAHLGNVLADVASAGVIERLVQPGRAQQLRFVADVLVSGGGSAPRAGATVHPLFAAPAAAGGVHGTVPSPAPAGTPGKQPPPTPASATGIVLEVGGVPISVPPGLAVEVELGADGRPHVRLVPRV